MSAIVSKSGAVVEMYLGQPYAKSFSYASFSPFCIRRMSSSTLPLSWSSTFSSQDRVTEGQRDTVSASREYICSFFFRICSYDAVVLYPAEKFVSTFKYYFFGYFDAINIFVDNVRGALCNISAKTAILTSSDFVPSDTLSRPCQKKLVFVIKRCKIYVIGRHPNVCALISKQTSLPVLRRNQRVIIQKPIELSRG